VIIDDANKYLINHYHEFDFIWSSPPCPTHSQIRYNIGFKANRKYSKVKAVYPDMTLYQEIILLNYYFGGKWVVENTVPYYEPLIPGVISGGHIWWANFHIPSINHGSRGHRDGTVESLQERKLTDLSNFDLKDKRKLLRNAVEPDVGLAVLEASKQEIKQGILL
jgi:DNA (cytosine-5)-methyltransferase 1